MPDKGIVEDPGSSGKPRSPYLRAIILVMVRFIKTEEIDMVLGWHFRNIDKVPGGRETHKLKFPLEYNDTIDVITGKTGFVLVAEENGHLAGYIGVKIDKRSSPYRAHLCGFYVDPQKRLKGHGRSLAKKAIVVAQEKGAKSLSVEVGLKKPWLIKFYESVGFLPSSMNMYQDFEKDSRSAY